MNKHKLKVYFNILHILLITFIFFINTVYAHSGGTDGKGGHYNSSTGEYHYHHGYPAHQHYDMDDDGDIDCPHDFKDNTNSNSSGNSSGSNNSNSNNSTNIIEKTNKHLKTRVFIVLFILLSLVIIPLISSVDEFEFRYSLIPFTILIPVIILVIIFG